MLFRFVFLTLLFLIFSCAEKNQNKNFDEKYAAQIQKLKQARGDDDHNSNIISARSTIPSQSEVANSKGSSYRPYVGVTRFGEKPKTNQIHSNETYDLSQAAVSAGLAPDVFDLNYNLSAHPPFRRIGIEFDNIRIPRADAYGVKTAISAKTYLSPGAKVLQRTIDEVSKSRSRDDVKMSKILVNEKKKITRKKQMEKIFGSYNEMKEE